MTPSTRPPAERLFTAAEVEAAVSAVIVYERTRTARLLAQHASLIASNAATMRAAAKRDERVRGRYLTSRELAEL